MKCPACKAWTEVRETRDRADGTTYRRYECANQHRFSTRETLTPAKPQGATNAAHQSV
jgi:transcriptional regulator NrdR family protein